MHQGNLKLGPDGALVALDFGIMGRIDAYTRRVYAEILIGFLHRDYARVAGVHFEAGYVPADQDRDAFAQALRSVGEPIFGQDATRISMARLLAHLFEVTERFGMQTRTELILLQRTMVVVEGVARSLNPQMNMWETSRPVVTDYIRSNLGPAAVARDLARDRAGPQPHRAAPAAAGRGGAGAGERAAAAAGAKEGGALGLCAGRGRGRGGAGGAGDDGRLNAHACARVLEKAKVNGDWFDAQCVHNACTTRMPSESVRIESLTRPREGRAFRRRSDQVTAEALR